MTMLYFHLFLVESFDNLPLNFLKVYQGASFLRIAVGPESQLDTQEQALRAQVSRQNGAIVGGSKRLQPPRKCYIVPEIYPYHPIIMVQ